MKRVILVHGWGGYPEEGWFPSFKKELEKEGYKVSVPAMSHPENPTIDDWVGHLAKVIGKPDENTFLVGHSIGCQTILRYLESLNGAFEENKKKFAELGTKIIVLHNAGHINGESHTALPEALTELLAL
jgi:predicted alpha/beta hydrolase family esterase